MTSGTRQICCAWAGYPNHGSPAYCDLRWYPYGMAARNTDLTAALETALRGQRCAVLWSEGHRPLYTADRSVSPRYLHVRYVIANMPLMAWFVTTVGKALAAAMTAAVPAIPPTAAVPPGASATHTIRAAAVVSGQHEPVPCPRAATPPQDAPPRPSPAPDDPAHRVVGGDQLATPGLVIPAHAPPPPAVTATSWLVADLGTGAVLGGCGPHEYATPASVQKLLLAATLLDRLDAQQIVTVTDADLQYEPDSSAVGLVEGGRYTVETLWLGLLLVSGNDAANVLARLGGGAAGADGGVQEMNLQAARLSAFQTHAVTPSGLDAPGQFTSAYDLALIARACFAEPAFRRYILTRQADIPAQPERQREGFQIHNQLNQLIDDYPGALGGKTGFTDLARHTYVGAAERGGRQLVVTLLAAESVPLRGWQQGAALLDWGFGLPSDASVGRLVEPVQAAVNPSQSPVHPIVNAHREAGAARIALFAMGAAAAAACVTLSAAIHRRRRSRRRTQI